jgi:hypothetical protein
MHISYQHQVNYCETNFCINFLSDFHSEENEFTNYESEQETWYEYIHENFQHDQKQIYLCLERLNIHQPIYDRYYSKKIFNIEDEQNSNPLSSTIFFFYLEPVYDDYVYFEFYEKGVNILFPVLSSFDQHMEESYFIKKNGYCAATIQSLGTKEGSLS